MNLMDVQLGKILLALYLIICGYQDFKRKQIDLRVCFVFYILVSAFYLYFGRMGYAPDFVGILLGVLPALLMFLLSWITKQGIGLGDAFFFLGLGYAMGIAAVGVVLVYSMLSMAVVSLCLLVYCVFSNRSPKGQTIPMIPYAVLPGMYVLLRPF